MTRRSPLLSAASLLVALACGPAAAAEFATKEEAIAMVKNAVAFIKERGPEKAYAEFTNKGGRFHDRDLYITVLDLDGKLLAHGQKADLIGKVLIDLKDPDVKLFMKERLELARRQPTFWQDYKFMNPTTKKDRAQGDVLRSAQGNRGLRWRLYVRWRALGLQQLALFPRYALPRRGGKS